MTINLPDRKLTTETHPLLVLLPNGVGYYKASDLIVNLEKALVFLKQYPESTVIRLFCTKEVGYRDQGTVTMEAKKPATDEEYLSQTFESLAYQHKYKQLIDLARELNVLHE